MESLGGITASSALLFSGWIHLIPTIGVLGGTTVSSLYGVNVSSDPNLRVLLRHRGSLLQSLLVLSAQHPSSYFIGTKGSEARSTSSSSVFSKSTVLLYVCWSQLGLLDSLDRLINSFCNLINLITSPLPDDYWLLACNFITFSP